MARANADDDAQAASKTANSTSQSGQQNVANSGHVEQPVLACTRREPLPAPSPHDNALASEPNSDQDAVRPVGYFTRLKEENSVLQPVYLVPGRENYLSFEAPPRSAQLAPGGRKGKRARHDDASPTEEPKSSTDANRVKRKAVPRTRSAPKPKSQRRSRVKGRFHAEEDNDNSVSVSTVSTHDLYLGDCEGMAFFYQTRCHEVNQTFLKQVVTRWLLALDRHRKRRYSSYTKKLPTEMPEGSTPPWWPRDIPYIEPSHLAEKYLLPFAVDLLLIHRRSDKLKRDMYPSWMLELKKHVDYVISTSSANIFSTSKDPAYMEAMKVLTVKVMHDLFQAAQSHEDHLAQYTLYEEMGNEDNGNGKYFTWSPISRPPKTISKPAATLNTEVSGDETEVDESPMPLSQSQTPSIQSAQPPVLRTPTTPLIAITAAPSQQPEAYHPMLLSHSPRISSPHRTFPPQTLPQTPSASFDQSMHGFLPTGEPRRNSEPHGLAFNEPPNSYNHATYDAFELHTTNRELCAFRNQVHPPFIPVSEAQLNGYPMPTLFQNIPTTMSTAASIYSAQPRYTNLYMQNPSGISYPLAHGYSLNIPPETPMESKPTMDNCNTSFASLCSDVDMTPVEAHGLPYVPNVQQSLHNLAYCNCQGRFCMCGAGQAPPRIYSPRPSNL
ncbi:hypothetical protein K505DRAFT_342363 [Melanomma pulvis-pyrius CBS 109.77]|uniref:Subtelomeric hrmA-associated cluster protein AFUB-079030/YDR124W-like helical bundle domain-containing protein n=1 Tax=Melanomma pulvis-pyrius CBS 109.77 TaxID=1314802 RepID=A0A6A6WW13_9PLEO|nr:hypothetical protein K505DRAFT_342363 [Melanomma pulvis-pyrius CBS 109.77]